MTDPAGLDEGEGLFSPGCGIAAFIGAGFGLELFGEFWEMTGAAGLDAREMLFSLSCGAAAFMSAEIGLELCCSIL